MGTKDHLRGETTATTEPGQTAGYHAGDFLRTRFSQWVMRAGGLKVNLLPLRDETAPQEAETAKTAAKATSGPDGVAPDKATASRNAQTCTFEVF